MLGFFLVLSAAVFFCFQNVIVRVLFTQQNLLGIWPTGGFVTPTLYHSLLLLFLRMALVVPLMAVVAPRLYPPTWKQLANLYNKSQWLLLGRSLLAGFLMFGYLVLLYIAVGLIPTGIALTLFFTYPVFTALLTWYFFGDRPTYGGVLIMVLILLGGILTLPQQNFSVAQGGGGIILAIASGGAYAAYTVLAQSCVKTLHPVPFTGMSFSTTLVLAAFSIFFWPGPHGDLPWLALWLGGLCSAVVTFLGHLLNNYGIRVIGASRAAMIGASNPALTCVLAWLTIAEHLTPVQISGVILVTLSVALLSRQLPNPPKKG